MGDSLIRRIFKATSVDPELLRGTPDETGALAKVRGLYQKHVPQPIQSGVKKALGAADLMGLSDPASAYGGGAGHGLANIGMLAKAPEASPQLRKILEYVTKRYPRLSKMGRESLFGQPVKTSAVGSYAPMTDTAVIAPERAGRTITDVLDTIFHETGHRRLAHKAAKAGRLEYNLRKNTLDAMLHGYHNMPEEKAVRAFSRGAIRSLEKRGMLPDDPEEYLSRARILMGD